MKEIIKAENITKTYKLGKTLVEALRGITLSINKGEFIVIVGPSGSGKSTLMHLLGALDTPTTGRILIDNKDISMLDEWHLSMIRRNKIGFIFQSFNLIPTLNALENVLMPVEVTDKDKIKATERAVKLLSDFGLSDRLNHKPSELSGGERQRVAIARALINDPEIIFADEPTGNLDSKTGLKIIELLTELNQKQKKTIVIVTHDQSLLQFASREIFIRDGLIQKDVKNGKKTHKEIESYTSQSIK